MALIRPGPAEGTERRLGRFGHFGHFGRRQGAVALTVVVVVDAGGVGLTNF